MGAAGQQPPPLSTTDRQQQTSTANYQWPNGAPKAPPQAARDSPLAANSLKVVEANKPEMS